MASGRGLIALAALAVVLAAALVVDHAAEDPPAVDRRLVPEASTAAIVSVEIRRPGEPAIAIARRPGGTLAITQPIETLVSADAAADLVGTLEQLAYRRHVAGRRTGTPRATVIVTNASGAAVELAIGPEIDATGQAWVSRADRPGSFAVDRHSARVLARGVDDLRSRAVVAGDPAAATRIELAPRGAAPITVLARGAMVDIGQAGAVAMDRAAAGELAAALGALQFERFVAARPPGPPELSIVVTAERGGQRIDVGGACPDEPALRVVSAPGGVGCVDAATVAALGALAARARGLWETRFAGEATAVARVALTVGRRRVEGDGDDPGVRGWLRDVDAAAGDPEATWIERPRADAAGSIELTDAGGAARRIDLFAVTGGAFALSRPGEAVARVVPAATARRFEPVSWQFRDRRMLARDPTEVRRITIRDRGAVTAELSRGELVGEWRAAAGAVDPAAADAMAAALAQLEAVELADLAPAQRSIRTLEIALDAAPGLPTGESRSLTIGERCWAQLDRDAVAFLVAEEPCRALRAAVVSPPARRDY